jgi:hypothetical protein
MGCGSSAGDGDNGDDALARQSTYALSCTIDTLVLEIPIELRYELDRPYAAGGSADLSVSATVTFTEQASTALAEAGVPKVDIVSLDIATSIAGATPTTAETSLGAAPINDFDLELDTDDNGLPGPHRIELDTTTTTTTVNEGADLVELTLGLDQVSLVLGDFQVPTDCVGPTLVGTTAGFPVSR